MLYLFNAPFRMVPLLQFCSFLWNLQWRNSYGLRVGKPAGTRAEGAPSGCPFTLVPAQITLSKSEVPFRTLFSLYSSKILITMHLALIDEIRIIWVPLQLGSSGGGASWGFAPWTPPGHLRGPLDPMPQGSHAFALQFFALCTTPS